MRLLKGFTGIGRRPTSANSSDSHRSRPDSYRARRYRCTLGLERLEDRVALSNFVLSNLASFNSAHAGLHAAVELQRTFAAGTSSLAIRVGVHSGFVMGDPEQMMGRNVVLAARIAGQAKGGEILVSSTARDYTQSDPSFRFQEHGEYHFKGLLVEHVVYSVLWR